RTRGGGKRWLEKITPKTKERTLWHQRTNVTLAPGDLSLNERYYSAHDAHNDFQRHMSPALLFPSSTLPPKKLGSSSEALFHVLATSEDPNGFLQQRPLSSPVLLVSEDNYMIAIGKTPVTTFTMDGLNEGLLYVMAYYYALHMTYPKCISTLLSVLQTEKGSFCSVQVCVCELDKGTMRNGSKISEPRHF
ncbi:unnamed protein product, partial [Pleuronectes platessa]